MVPNWQLCLDDILILPWSDNNSVHQALPTASALSCTLQTTHLSTLIYNHNTSLLTPLMLYSCTSSNNQTNNNKYRSFEPVHLKPMMFWCIRSYIFSYHITSFLQYFLNSFIKSLMLIIWWMCISSRLCSTLYWRLSILPSWNIILTRLLSTLTH